MPWPSSHFPVRGHAAVGADREPGIELPRHPLILGGEGPLRERGVLEQRRRAAEADDQRAAAFQELPARGHHAFFSFA
jgi:hypothetical protein